MTTLFDYELIGTGWAELTISNGNKTLTFQISYLSDPLADLLEGLLKLCSRKSEKEKIVFAEEPGEHSLILTLHNNDELEIDVYWSDEWGQISNAYGTTTGRELLYSDTDTLPNFAKEVRVCMQKLLEKHDLKGYQEKWHLYGFPEHLLDQLKTIIKD